MTKSKKATEVITPQNLFNCDICKGLPQMEFTDFKKHLFTEHHLKENQLTGSKQMQMHIDFDNYYTSTYRWELDNGLIFYQHITSPRKTPMY